MSSGWRLHVSVATDIRSFILESLIENFHRLSTIRRGTAVARGIREATRYSLCLALWLSREFRCNHVGRGISFSQPLVHGTNESNRVCTISARRFALAAIAYRSPRHFAIFRANDVLCILPWSIFVHDSLENDYYYRKAQMLSAQITFLDKFLGRLRYRLTDIAIFDSSNVLLSHKHSVTRTFRLCGTFLTDPGDVVDAIATRITGLGTPRLFTPSILCHGKESFFVDLRLDGIRSAV